MISSSVNFESLIRKCVFPYQFLLLKIHLSLRSSLISGKLPFGKLGQRIGSGNACYRNQKSPTIPYLDKAVAITIGLLPVGSIEGASSFRESGQNFELFQSVARTNKLLQRLQFRSSSSILRNSRRT
jgi:hypothetical protein